MFALKHTPFVDVIRLGKFHAELIKYGYPEHDTKNLIKFLRGTPDHPLLYDVNGPDWLFHLTTCSRAEPVQLIDHYARLHKLSDNLINGDTRYRQCSFDFKARWPKSLFRYEDLDPLSMIGQKAPKWLVDHQENLFSLNERTVALDFTRFTSLLDVYVSYPVL